MRIQLFSVMFITCATLAARQTDLAGIGRQLSQTGCGRAAVSYEILMPSSDTPVRYDIDLMSMPAAPGDTLAPCDYLIDWTLHTPAGTTSEGFSAYTGGNHFRYRDGRLQEYHATDDSAPFLPDGTARRGVASAAQFVDITPQALGRQLAAMADDDNFIFDVDVHPDVVTVSGKESTQGYDFREFTYRLDPATFLPREIEIDYNPGAPSEQVVTVRYGAWTADSCLTPDESCLTARYPEVFSRYRTDSFTLENLPGRRMPGWALPTIDGGRSVHTAGEPFGHPVVVVFVNSEVGDPAADIADMNALAERSAVTVGACVVFTDKDRRRIAEMLPAPGPGVEVMANGASLARDCGVALTPSTIICNADGVVTDIIVGRNKNHLSDVLQKVIIAK